MVDHAVAPSSELFDHLQGSPAEEDLRGRFALDVFPVGRGDLGDQLETANGDALVGGILRGGGPVDGYFVADLFGQV